MEQETKKQKEKERDSLYLVGWLLIGAAALIFAMTKLTGISISKFLLPCLVHELTGYYCPGCGGSRAVSLLLQGHFIISFYYHPVVLYGGGLFLWFMLSNTVEHLSRGRLRIGLYYRDRFVYIAVIILVINFAVKNAVLFIWNYQMIP